MGTRQRIQVSVAKRRIETYDERFTSWPLSFNKHYSRQLGAVSVSQHVHSEHCLVCFAYSARDRLEFKPLVCLIPMAARKAVILPIYFKDVDGFSQPDRGDALHQRLDFRLIILSRPPQRSPDGAHRQPPHDAAALLASCIPRSRSHLMSRHRLARTGTVRTLIFGVHPSVLPVDRRQLGIVLLGLAAV